MNEIKDIERRDSLLCSNFDIRPLPSSSSGDSYSSDGSEWTQESTVERE